jgi:hypothetical protein
MGNEQLERRLHLLMERLRTSYDGIGHSSGRPYVYFVYDPADESRWSDLFAEHFRNDSPASVPLYFHIIDILPITIASFEGDEEGRQEVLNDPMLVAEGRREIVELWSDNIRERIVADVAQTPVGRCPVAVLYGLAALHPLGTPTSLMEFLAETEPRDERTGRVVPIVVLVPGYLAPRTSRFYHFLDREQPLLDFYRGEEI